MGALLFLVLILAATGYVEAQVGPTGQSSSLLLSEQELAGYLGKDEIRILDARPANRYAEGHIPGAANLAIGAITRTSNGVPGVLAPVAAIEAALGNLGVSQESPVVIYDEFGGVAATRLFWVLDHLGHGRVSVLQGGFQSWELAGRPVSRDVPRRGSVRYQSAPRPDRLADRAWVQAHLNDPSIILLDARSPQEFNGNVPGRKVQRPGHIPGAVNVDWVLNLTSTEPRRFKNEADLTRLYRSAGVTPDKEIIVYCRTGVRASHDYFVLRLLGYPRVRLYDGSFVEWSADRTLPVTR